MSNNVRENRYTHSEEGNWILISHYMQKPKWVNNLNGRAGHTCPVLDLKNISFQFFTVEYEFVVYGLYSVYNIQSDMLYIMKGCCILSKAYLHLLQ
jgi:hypothetical protein